MSLQKTEITPEQVQALNNELEKAPLIEVLRALWQRFGTRAAIGTSFQGAGLVMIDHAIKAGLPFPVFTLDTGLLFPETYTLRTQLEKHWGISIESTQPELTVEQQSAHYGDELWKRTPDVCCALRKVEPLQRKLSQIAVWITGLRREQSDTREGARLFELYQFDDLRDLYILKANPMAAWTREAVWAYLKENNIPTNPLHDRGYRSIGCWPCTRPTAEGENERAGRWTGFDKKECGIHTFLGASI